jgi:hypothetical protein
LDVPDAISRLHRYCEIAESLATCSSKSLRHWRPTPHPRREKRRV